MIDFSEYKLYRIIRSRFLKNIETDRVKLKRNLCKNCEYNSLNQKKVKILKRILIKLSDFYSWFCGKSKKDNLGNCTACQSCSIFFKTLDEEHCPHPVEDKWKEI